MAGALLAGPVLAGACSDDGAGEEGSQAHIVVTTSILGDITSHLVGDADVSVETVMPPGADPHEFEASSRQAEALLEADLLVTNGAGFEAGLEDLIGQAGDAGVEVFSFADHVELLPAGGSGHDHEDEGHEEEGHDDEAHEHGADDPHLWTDPTRVAAAATELAGTVAGLDGVDAAAVEEAASAYIDDLEDLDAEVERVLDPVPDERRVLVTNHEVFGYFADRYGFEVVGAVIPSTSTLAEPSAGELEDLGTEIEEHEVPAIFAETTQSSDLADSLAGSVGDVEVVELHSESLGEGGSGAETYLEMMRTNADRIAGALS